MAIKKIEIRPKGDGTFPDVLYPRTSVDQVDGLQTALDGKATATQGQQATDVYNRFLAHAQVITNWNNVTQNGIYMADNAPNGPSTGWFIGQVYAHNQFYVTQKLMGVTGTKSFERQMNNNVWSPWKETSEKVVYDKASGGVYPDPNTSLDSAFITDHANVQSAGSVGGHWFVEQIFYSHSGPSANRSQIARSYVGGVADMKTRHYNAGTWTPWSPSMQSLFNSVSNGKSAVANAITQKGVATSATAEFATMANNIMAIAGGRKFATGVTLADASGFLAVNTINFIPAVIVVWIHRASGNHENFGIYAGNSTTNVGYNVSATTVNGYTSSNTFTALSNGFTASMGAYTQYGWVAIGY